MPDSDTIQTLFTTTNDTIHAHRDTIHYTTLHRNTQDWKQALNLTQH